MVKRALFSAALLAASAASAAPPAYTITPEKSSLTFDATQNDAVVSGRFATFSGDIVFDPKALAQSSVKVTVELASVASDTENMAETLAAPDWFDSAKFPHAVFESHAIKSLGGNRYEAVGTLNLRGVTQPLTLPFTLTAYDASHAAATGSGTLSRTAFHVGWADTGQVGDGVKLVFSVTATAKSTMY